VHIMGSEDYATFGFGEPPVREGAWKAPGY
jgi:hypothetical protein